MGALLQVAAGIGDGDQVRGNFLGFQVHLKVIKHSVEYAAHLNGAARFAGNEHERAFQIEACKNRAHANGRYGVEHLEVERVAVDFVVFGDGHGSLSGAALTNKQNGFKAFGDDAFCESLDFFIRIGRLARKRCPAGVVLCAFGGSFVEIVEACILGVKAAGDFVANQNFCRGVELLGIADKHKSSFSQSMVRMQGESLGLRCRKLPFTKQARRKRAPESYLRCWEHCTETGPQLEIITCSMWR